MFELGDVAVLLLNLVALFWLECSDEGFWEGGQQDGFVASERIHYHCCWRVFVALYVRRFEVVSACPGACDSSRVSRSRHFACAHGVVGVAGAFVSSMSLTARTNGRVGLGCDTAE